MTMTHDEWQSSLQEWKSGVEKIALPGLPWGAASNPFAGPIFATV